MLKKENKIICDETYVLICVKKSFFIETVKMEWSPVGHWSQWPEVTSPRQLLPEDEKNWRANCFCSNRLDTGRQEAVDFSLPSNPLLLLFPPNDTICGIINKQGVKFHKRRNSSQSVNNSDFDLRQALLINVSLVPTLF